MITLLLLAVVLAASGVMLVNTCPDISGRWVDVIMVITVVCMVLVILSPLIDFIWRRL